LHVAQDTVIEVRTEFGDEITAQRGADGSFAMFNTKSKLPIHADDRGLGLASTLNSKADMDALMGLFNATPSQLRARVAADADLIALSRTPLDQLFDLASRITAGEVALNESRTRRSDLSETIREREEREQTLTKQQEVTSGGKRKINSLTLVSFGIVAIGIAAAVLVDPIIGIAICGVALVVAIAGQILKKKVTANDTEDQALDIQLGRVDELFDTHSISRNRRLAEDTLAESVAQWRNIAGNVKPSALVNDRPRIEELASHLRLIENENVAPADTDILVGFASLLAELNRRFPAERVPLLISDLFPEVAPQYHGVLRDLILRASHRRQVVLETGDLTAAKWAAVEAVGGDALLISDFDIDVEPIINQAVAAEPQ